MNSRNLIVYFSHNKENYVSGKIVNLEKGNAKVIAEKLSDMTSADMYELLPVDDYPYVYGETTDRAKKEKNANARPEIRNKIPSIEDFKDIYLVYPNWWSTMPMIMMTFLESYDFTGKNIHPICTHEGSGMGSSVTDLKKLCPTANICKGLDIKGSTANSCDQKLKNWLK